MDVEKINQNLNDAEHNSVYSCAGSTPQSAHPRVYLTFREGENQLNCPYCGKAFHQINEE